MSLSHPKLTLSGAVLSSILMASGLFLTGCQKTTTAQTEKTQTDQHNHNHDGHTHDHHDHHHDHDHHDHGEHDHHHDHDHPISNVVLAPPQPADLALVTVSNYPLYLLSNAVTEGTPVQATMLLKPGNIGHHGSLTPEDKKTVQDSHYVVWFGDALEHNLTNTIVQVLVSTHSQANPQYAEQFQANAIKFAKEMDDLAKRYHGEQIANYWAYHDAFQYIEDALNLQLAGTLTTDHEIPIKASQYIWLNEHRPNEQMCLLSQSTPQDGVINKLKPVHHSVHIEDMSDSQNFLQAWENIAKGINDCVKRT